MFDILFLGTGASVPSRDKSLPCIAVRQGRSVTLFDCGEGSQRQLMISPFSFMKVDRIFISHMHGDHILGLPGLLQTMGMSGRREPVSVFGPKGIGATLKSLLDACEGELEFETEIHEVEGEECFDFGSFSVSVFPTVHNTPSVGYVYRESMRPGVFNKDKAEKLGLCQDDFSKLQRGETVKGVSPSDVIGCPRPGCSLVYTGDTIPCPPIAEAAKGVDVLIHEATYLDEDSDMAAEHFHSTAKAAAETARDADVRMLALVHISNRYGDNAQSLAEAAQTFGDTVAPSDMEMYTVMPGEIRRIVKD